MKGKVKCTCGWEWNKSNSSKKDMYICHECGRDNSNNMQNGGWLDSYADGGTMQEHQENYNDYEVSAPEGFKGNGYSNVGRNYSPAWGGQFQEGGEIPNAQNGKKKPIYKKNKVQKIEKRIDNFLGKPQQRAMSMADISPNEDPVDNIRHSFAGRYTQDAIAKKLGNGPIANIAGLAGSNLMGAAHELSTIIKDDRSWLTKLRESGEDMVNNAVGSVIGAIPFMGEKAKDKMMYKMSYGNLLPDGYVSTEKSKKKRYSDNMYFKNKKGKVDREYQMGGNIYPVNYVPQAQGGMSTPGAVGFSYARIGAPSKGPRRNQTDVTDASAQNGKEMQYYREGLDWKPKSIGQEGTQVVNSRQKRGLDLLVKETNNAKKDREELNTTGQIKKPRSLHYKKLTPKQQPTLSQDKMSVVDRQKANNAMEQVNKEQLGVLERPLIYLASPEKVLGDIGVPGMETSEEDRQKIMVNRYNPYQSNEDRLKNTIEMGLGYVPEATVNTGLAMMGMENPTVGKLANEIFNPLAGIKTSISPELRQGIRTNGFLDIFKSKKPMNTSGQDWLHKWNNDPITLNKIAEREKLSEISSHPRFEEAFPEYPVIKEGQLADKELNDIKTEFINNVIGNDRNFPIKTNIKEIPVLSYEDLKINEPQTYKETINKSMGISPGRSKVYIDDAQFKNLPLERKESTKVHELTHSAENNGDNLTINEQKELLAPFDKNNFQLDRPIWDGKTYGESYYTEPTEIHARMNQGRFQLGLSPKDKFTEEMFDKVSKENDWQGMGKYIKDKKGFIDLMNNFWAVPPAVIGAGALQQGTQEEVPQYKQGGIIKDDRGQWAHPGEITEIGSNNITMQGVPYDVLGISDTGDTKLMKPGKNYKFKGKKVTEFPMAKNGRRQEQKGLQNLEDLTNFTNYNKPSNWLNKYN
jgi:hypothetical protein